MRTQAQVGSLKIIDKIDTIFTRLTKRYLKPAYVRNGRR